MKIAMLSATFALMIGPALAQQADQSAFLAKAAGVLQQQRDEAMNNLVNAQAKNGLMSDENAALRKAAGELESKVKALTDENAALKDTKEKDKP